MSYRYKKDQVIAFTSELIKYYYLANFCNILPIDIKIDYTSYGRPFIVNSKLDFNISHAGEYLVLAIIDSSKVGIDIEECDNSINPAELGSIVFSSVEQELIDNDINKFFKLWTKKEALIKAHGTGFGSDFYKNTRLNLDSTEFIKNGIICCNKVFSNYYLAVCVL